jgi:hypothetical protein
MSGRGPDYRVAVSGRREGHEKSVSTYIGAAWTNRAGGIGIRLNPGVQLLLTATTELVLWPNDDQRGGGGQGSRRNDVPPADPFNGDDIPF